MPLTAFAHRSGCHNLHTCPSDSGTYECGDLGYPCNGATSIKDIPLSLINVPLLVEKAFTETFGRKPTDAESAFWKNRFRNDKDGLYKIRKTMVWHKTQGSFGPRVSSSTIKARLIKNMNAMFASIYGRDPSIPENQYWLSRIEDKPDEQALLGAMGWHKARNIHH